MLTKSTGIFALLIAGMAFWSLSWADGQNVPALRTEWGGNDYVDLRLVSAMDRLPKDGALDIALEIKLKEGWVTYWVMPGISGFPPKIVGRKLKNIDEFEVYWPAPEVHTLPFSKAVGYDGHFFVPIRLVVDAPHKDASISLDWQIAVCEEICVLLREEMALRIPGARSNVPAAATADHADIVRAKSKLPVRSEADGRLGEQFLARQAILQGGQYNHQLEVVVETAIPETVTTVPELYVAGPMAVRFGTPDVFHDVTAGTLRYSFPAYLSEPRERLLGEAVKLVLVTQNGAHETSLTITQPNRRISAPIPASQL